MKPAPSKTIERLILYRKLLNILKGEGTVNIYSHKLASLAGRTPAQVRRDLMLVGYNGSPVRGYAVKELLASISKYLDDPRGQSVAIIGIGNLGRAVMDYCFGKNPKITIIAAFDKDPAKVDRIIHGTHCYHIDDIEKIVREKNITMAIIAVPPEEAQAVAENLERVGIKGILNYTAVRLNLSSDVFVENRDMMRALEKVAFFARNTHKSAKK